MHNINYFPKIIDMKPFIFLESLFVNRNKLHIEFKIRIKPADSKLLHSTEFHKAFKAMSNYVCAAKTQATSCSTLHELLEDEPAEIPR